MFGLFRGSVLRTLHQIHITVCGSIRKGSGRAICRRWRRCAQLLMLMQLSRRRSCSPCLRSSPFLRTPREPRTHRNGFLLTKRSAQQTSNNTQSFSSQKRLGQQNQKMTRYCYSQKIWLALCASLSILSVEAFHQRSLSYRRSSLAISFLRSPVSDSEQLPFKSGQESVLFSDAATFESARVEQLSDSRSVFLNSTITDMVMVESDGSSSIIEKAMNSYLGPRVLLAAVACLYGTNFPLGSIMDNALPASAASSARFLVASLAMFPFVFQIRKEFVAPTLIAGAFTATGYITQSLALVDTSPATVSFLGAATVIWCPFLEWLVDKKPMGIHDRPQTWMAATLCLIGVAVLELCGGGAAEVESMGIGVGDGLSLLQAIGFGTGLFMSEKMVSKHSDQALPVTAGMVATTALLSMGWALADGWMYNTPNWESMTLPNMLLDPSMREVAFAVVWTGLLSTSLNFFLEVYSLQKVPSGEASVILASEPLWAAAFASVILGERLGWNDYVGGIFIVSACLVNCLTASDFHGVLPGVDASASKDGSLKQ